MSEMRKRAQELRKNATKEENLLWYCFLRGYPLQFRRQVCFDRYIVDFYCRKAKIAIELDGSQHYEPETAEFDGLRTAYLEKTFGIKMLRFTNLEIAKQFDAVCEEIDRQIKNRMIPMKTVTIYTDGACSGNPGPGGWAAILCYGGQEKLLSGGEETTTNNRMELTAVISALQALKEPCAVELYSDSKYVIDALEKGWAENWRKRGWVKPDKKPALNPDLWQMLLELCNTHEMHLHWVKGHADNEYNERCDRQAVAEWMKFKTD